MLETKNKLKLAFLTCILDIAIINTYVSGTSKNQSPIQTANTNLPLYDKIFCILILGTHLFFYIFLYFYNEDVLQFIHVIVFLSLGISVFLSNINLIIICLFLIIVIQIQWVIEKRCILNEKKYDFGYSKDLEIYTRIITIILLIKVIYASATAVCVPSSANASAFLVPCPH